MSRRWCLFCPMMVLVVGWWPSCRVAVMPGRMASTPWRTLSALEPQGALSWRTHMTGCHCVLFRLSSAHDRYHWGVTRGNHSWLVRMIVGLFACNTLVQSRKHNLQLLSIMLAWTWHRCILILFLCCMRAEPTRTSVCCKAESSCACEYVTQSLGGMGQCAIHIPHCLARLQGSRRCGVLLLSIVWFAYW